jgi:hypothetical protein
MKLMRMKQLGEFLKMEERQENQMKKKDVENIQILTPHDRPVFQVIDIVHQDVANIDQNHVQDQDQDVQVKSRRNIVVHVQEVYNEKKENVIRVQIHQMNNNDEMKFQKFDEENVKRREMNMKVNF